jgi:formylglycine-generating enzyme required for sulfatase activity
VKPDNILLEERTGRAKLGDFGLSRAASDVSVTVQGLGTPAYASPEQCFGEPVDQRSDLYSLGLVLYEVLTGQGLSVALTPGAVSVPYAIRQQSVREPPPAPHHLEPSVPPALSQAVMKAFARRPQDRYQSARELAEALRRALAAPAVELPPRVAAQPSPEGPATPQLPPARRRRASPTAAVALLGVLGVALVVGITGLWAIIRWAADNPSRHTIESHLGNKGPEFKAGLTPRKLRWGKNDKAYPDRLVVNPADGAELVWVPGGTFGMGSTQEELDRLWQQYGWSADWRSGTEDQLPRHEVTLDGFWIYKHEVTNGQYAKFHGTATNRAGPEEGGGKKGSVLEQDEHHPRVEITWTEAEAYARRAGGRLPTEAQWEYAARGAERRQYPWGDTWDAAKCNCAEQWAGHALTDTESMLAWQASVGIRKREDGSRVIPARQAVKFLTDVGSFPQGASWCAALDLAGSVNEWCADWYGKDYYASSPAQNPPGPTEGSERVGRGGAWGARAPYCRTAARGSDTPDTSDLSTGLRCVVTVEAK